jgi:hypothetical protein
MSMHFCANTYFILYNHSSVQTLACASLCVVISAIVPDESVANMPCTVPVKEYLGVQNVFSSHLVMGALVFSA